MRKKVAEANERIRKAESDRETAESTVIAVSWYTWRAIILFILSTFYQLKDDITVKMQEIDKETRRKTKLEKELRQCQV